MSNLVKTELRDSVFLIGLNRADKRNAMNFEMMKALAAAYGEFEANTDARVGLLYGEGDHFCAGLELPDCAEHLMSPKSESWLEADERDPWSILTERPTRPVVMAAQGACFTVGVELTLASDIVVAGDNAKFAQLEISRGIFPFGGGTIRWPLASGYQNAMRYLLTGDVFDAEEAKRLGMVQDIVAPGDVFDHSFSMAKRIAAHAPRGVRATLRTARRAQNHGLEAAADTLYPEVRSIYSTEDAAIGIKTFMDKKRPQFTGK
ncbi:MAG: crotonase/enoyl-CoA hydratase family protein [Pseudomonadota bacterium]